MGYFEDILVLFLNISDMCKSMNVGLSRFKSKNVNYYIPMHTLTWLSEDHCISLTMVIC